VGEILSQAGSGAACGISHRRRHWSDIPSRI